MASLQFRLSEDDPSKVEWWVIGDGTPQLTEQQAMLILVANVAASLENIAAQFEEIARHLGPDETDDATE